MTRYQAASRALLEQNPQLRFHQRKKLGHFFTKLLVIEVIVISLTIYLMEFTESAVVLGICFAILLPGWILKPQLIFAKCGIGTIKEIEKVSKRVTREKGMAVFHTDLQSKLFIVCRIIGEKGQEIEFELPVQYEKVFHVGDCVLRIPAIEYPINLSEHDWILCPFCGNIFPKVNDRCVECNAKSIMSTTE